MNSIFRRNKFQDRDFKQSV